MRSPKQGPGGITVLPEQRNFVSPLQFLLRRPESPKVEGNNFENNPGAVAAQPFKRRSRVSIRLCATAGF